ncbi:hypothetical protein [Zymomonas mobilis]|uniref:Uncharacterized protein n=1 Tax=Zymomonas mobilis subsp. mobilis (strain ATCC 31821 / ZM4 / CP4) TaxID=264203 RepID=A0A806D7S2_ZYMMO|nr:hypothetical protein [Zymomonas mobilis]ADC33844.1 hypothetical protein ZZM4_0068 [Zymomonas mobilis subsp. mobilis ZM4 = ATCC 31821]AHB11099.1 hypothetical protein ZCP4_1840 [Zymomonas mobilis subsp. mobilis str. CP4 = NRRL B-14023]AHJ71351.1 hypothetical protein A254_01768 [Zymomonas mobilis subsp. mobilis NRRL B-12526]AHJ73219.1 hypothetical protein A265_01782 [Zymomonas mobilis subsp. mobilis str. CP4 = NRRL B-14023]TWE24255.1 hypothetical protein FBY52_1219 [Zymomonas mobilis]
MTIKTAENMSSLVDSEISTFKQKISNALYLYMGQMECGLRLLMDRLEGIRRAEETRSYALLENVSKDEFIRFNTEILSLIEVIKRSATTANVGLAGFIENFGSSL